MQLENEILTAFWPVLSALLCLGLACLAGLRVALWPRCWPKVGRAWPRLDRATMWGALTMSSPVTVCVAVGVLGLGAGMCLALFGILCATQMGHDMRRGLLPLEETLLIAGLGTAAILAGFAPLSAQDAAAGSLFGAILFLALNWIWRKIRGVTALGGGDIKLVAALGLWVGLSGLGAFVFLAASVALCVAYWRGSTGKIAFGPFLCLAALVVVWGNLLDIRIGFG